MNIVDPRSADQTIEDVQTLEEIKTILPYFPDSEKAARYICYISSGWTRSEAKIRAGLTQEEYKQWLKDDRFREIDSSPYEARKKVANAYAELKIRRNAIEWLEYDSEFTAECMRKIAAGEELTKDERALFLKRASIYTPDSFRTANNVGEAISDDVNSGESTGFDIAVFVRSRKGQ